MELDLDEFMSFMSKEIMENDVKEELVEAYRKFTGTDDSSGGISLQQLQDTMIAYGERRMTKEEL